MNAPTLTPRNWHDALSFAREDHANACYWIGFIKGQARADGNEAALVRKCQFYLDVYGIPECEAEALAELEAMIADPDEYVMRGEDYGDFRCRELREYAA